MPMITSITPYYTQGPLGRLQSADIHVEVVGPGHLIRLPIMNELSALGATMHQAAEAGRPARTEINLVATTTNRISVALRDWLLQGTRAGPMHETAMRTLTSFVLSTPSAETPPVPPRQRSRRAPEPPPDTTTHTPALTPGGLAGRRRTIFGDYAWEIMTWARDIRRATPDEIRATLAYYPELADDTAQAVTPARSRTAPRVRALPAADIRVPENLHSVEHYEPGSGWAAVAALLKAALLELPAEPNDQSDNIYQDLRAVAERVVPMAEVEHA